MEGMYVDDEEDYDEEEDDGSPVELPSPNKIFQPSTDYPPLHTFDFQSVRCHHTKFDDGFDRDSDSSMLIFISMHGSIPVYDEDDEFAVYKCKYLNKFSAAGPGQCAYVAEQGSRYIAYALCNAIHHQEVLDVSTILRESSAHHYALRVPESAIKTYAKTIPPSLEQHEKSNASDLCIKSSEILGDRMSIGT